MLSFQTFPDMLNHVNNSYSNPTAMNFRNTAGWQPMSTGDFINDVKRLTMGLISIGLKTGDCLGILAEPSPHWLMMDLAAIIAGGVTVPIYANISSEHLSYEIKDSEMKYMFFDTHEKHRFLAPFEKHFQNVIGLDTGIHDADKKLISFADLMKKGDELAAKEPGKYGELAAAAKGDQLATIIYTSGSTGTPKGVMLSQHNIMCQVSGTWERIPLYAATDITVSLLPLAHIFQRMVVYYFLSTGISVYFADDVKKAGDLLREIKPTVITVVPRLLEKVFAKMQAGVEEGSGLKKFLGSLALKRALTRDPINGRRGIMDFIYNLLVFSKFRKAMGGNLRLVISGSAPLSHELTCFFLNIGVPVYEGYGLTESSPVLAVNTPDNNKPGSVGKAFTHVELKISPEGEILARGPNIMQGYHKRDDANVETLDKDGYLHTGDLGEIDKDGFLTIKGRVKELYKTSTGKYVSPVPIEQKLVKMPVVDMAVVIAEGRKFTSALIFPDLENLADHKAKMGLSDLSDDDFLASENLLSAVDEHISEMNKTLDKCENVVRYRIIKEPISIETGEITPSMKIRRHMVEKKFLAEIEEMYKD